MSEHPLLLQGHGGGLHARHPGVVARARDGVLRDGCHVVSLDAPGHGDRPRSAADEEAVAVIGRTRRAGEPLGPVLSTFNASLAARAVPEWQALLDVLLPELGDVPVGYAGLTLASSIGIPLLVAEPRVVAARVGGVFAWDWQLDAARRVTVPVEVLLPWDDPEIPREDGLAVFDALGSADKTLLAFPGSHRHVPGDRLETGFFRRHLV